MSRLTLPKPAAERSLTNLPAKTRLPRPASQLSGVREAVLATALFIGRRLVFGLLVLVTIILLSHLGLAMARGEPFSLTQAGAETIDTVSRLVRGDLGTTAAGNTAMTPLPVIEVVSATLFKSLGLLATALLLATVLGVGLGTWSARRRNSGHSLAVLLVSLVGISAPSFFIALILQYLVLRWTQATGRTVLPVGGFGWDSHLILPALVLAARPVAQIARVTFVALSEVLEQDFVRTAHSKGLPPVQVIGRHVLRNAAVPILTTVGLSLRFSLSSLPVVEFFFGWPGVGFTLLKAISRQDDNLTVVLALCLGVLFILVNLFLDGSYRLIDPRLRQAPTWASRETQVSLLEALRSVGATLRDWLVDNPLGRWLTRRQTAEPEPFAAVLRRPSRFGVNQGGIQAERRKAWRRGILGNLPFVAGAIVVLGLAVIILFGPALAPHNPYTTQGLAMVEGKLTVPPFAPGPAHPWGTDVLGRDLLSLVLAGAKQTLLLALLVVGARLLVGFILGAIAGWWPGSWLDRLLLGAAETLAAFPALLLAMILILALGIRQGMRPFVIALCFIGWGEILQFVRGQVLAIRPKLFIESAIAVGLRSPRIILSHVLPNLVPALISLGALEMGAVLMLLGELGFVGIFMGGGAFAELDAGGLLYHYSDVPEWGSLLSNVRTYARAYPWTAFYPTLVFFIAILGFNLFGEGLRRLVEGLGLNVTRLVNRYTAALAVLLVFGLGWARANTGVMPFYRQQAGGFDGQKALAHVQVLASPIMQGRAIGSPQLDASADYIAGQFAALGLQAAGEDFTYFQTRERAFGTLAAVPRFEVGDSGSAPIYRQDYAEYAGGYFRNQGQAQGKVHFLAMGPLSGNNPYRQPALSRLNFADDILLVVSAEDAGYTVQLPRQGVLVVAAELAQLQRHGTLATRDPNDPTYLLNRLAGRDAPTLLISEPLANRLLQGTGYTVAGLRQLAEGLGQDEVANFPLEVTATLEVNSQVQERIPVRHVIGHLPGESMDLDNHLILVLAQYDSPPSDPTGTVYPAANDNASSVAVMLEAIRLMRATDYQPYKTFLFVAYSGEGMEGGEFANPPDVTKFLDAKYGFSTAFDIEAVIYLRGLGAGSGDSLAISAGGSLRLADLFETAANRMGVPVTRKKEPVDLSIVFTERSSRVGGQEAPQVEVGWDGWQENSHLPADTVMGVSPDRLDRAGRVLALALMIIGRETRY